MTSIYRTAYPYFKANTKPTQAELNAFYQLSDDELAYIKKHIRGDALRLGFAVQLKIFQHFHYFPKLKTIPKEIVEAIRQQLLFIKEYTDFQYQHESALYRHRRIIYTYCHSICWEKSLNRIPGSPIHPGRHFAIKAAYQAAQIMNNPADIINVVIESLHKENYELPPFDELSRLVRHVRQQVNQKLFLKIAQQLSEQEKCFLDSLLEIKPDYNRSDFNALKQSPKKPTISHFKEWLKRHEWLVSMDTLKRQVENIPSIKRKQFSGQAGSLDASDLKKCSPEKRYTLMACLLHETHGQSNDSLAIIYCKTIAKMHKKSIEKLESIKKKSKEKTKKVATTLKDLLEPFKRKYKNAELVRQLKLTIEDRGGVEELEEDCDQVLASNADHAFHLLPAFYASKRATLFRLVETLSLASTHQDDGLMNAIVFIRDNKNNKEEYLSSEIDLSFTTREWRKMLVKKSNNKVLLHHQLLECCVFSHLAEDLHSGDIFIKNANTYADYRESFLPMEVCETQIDDYCHSLGIANTGTSAVIKLREALIATAKRVDDTYPMIKELVIDDKGCPVLKKRDPKRRSSHVIWLMEEIRKRMPERTFLDILCNTHHYTGWANHFSPISGDETKMDNPIERYILTSFAYGTALGPTQTVQHLQKTMNVSAHMLSWINRRYVEPKTLDKARESLINFSNSFPLPKAWGDGKSVAGDGNLRELREENLIAAFHMRYSKKGGIAYHHVANNYIALFSTFIPCGVWEAVEIIEGLLKNTSDIQPDTIHADTQGQSTVVFALAYLLGFKLMPRIRNWKDYRFFRAKKDAKYKHIDSLFSDNATINWKLIETHWKDMLQVVLSIKAGKINSSLLLRKLGSKSRKNKLYFAFQELGRVIRTQFLLTYISDVELREIITDTTNKVESYNSLSEWSSFGSTDLVASNEEKEMEKAIKYNSIITNSIILQNIIDMTEIIMQLLKEGYSFTKEELGFLSPYLREHIKRYGDFVVDILRIPEDISQHRYSSLW